MELIPSRRATSTEFAEIAKSDPKLTLVSLKDEFCHEERCYFANGADLYYFDADHLSDVGAMHVMPLLSKTLEGN